LCPVGDVDVSVKKAFWRKLVTDVDSEEDIVGYEV